MVARFLATPAVFPGALLRKYRRSRSLKDVAGSQFGGGGGSRISSIKHCFVTIKFILFASMPPNMPPIAQFPNLRSARPWPKFTTRKNAVTYCFNFNYCVFAPKFLTLIDPSTPGLVWVVRFEEKTLDYPRPGMCRQMPRSCRQTPRKRRQITGKNVAKGGKKAGYIDG